VRHLSQIPAGGNGQFDELLRPNLARSRIQAGRSGEGVTSALPFAALFSEGLGGLQEAAPYPDGQGGRKSASTVMEGAGRTPWEGLPDIRSSENPGAALTHIELGHDSGFRWSPRGEVPSVLSVVVGAGARRLDSERTIEGRMRREQASPFTPGCQAVPSNAVGRDGLKDRCDAWIGTAHYLP
jgi:hypothetical protein